MKMKKLTFKISFPSLKKNYQLKITKLYTTRMKSMATTTHEKHRERNRRNRKHNSHIYRGGGTKGDTNIIFRSREEMATKN